jgi:probable F420-dependent oxidoreductase
VTADGRRFKVGVTLHPQQCSLEELRAAWARADAWGVDSIWVWDHFFPLYGDPDGPHFEAWTALTAMALDTRRAQVGVLVSAAGYRNAQLVTEMAKNVDQLSGGRAVLGLGAGWCERDHRELGFALPDRPQRAERLVDALRTVVAKRARLVPPPIGRLPVLVGGKGERRVLPAVARYADMWNTTGPVAHFAQKNAALDRECAAIGRPPSMVERTVLLEAEDVAAAPDYVAAGATHLIMSSSAPFTLREVQELLDAAGATADRSTT